ncbi:MAG: GntR family transcriptional regulator [Desulfobacteraceae bacterium]|nr:GntR family transcriptional regulator [Desulfobacteraceae bacterium]
MSNKTSMKSLLAYEKIRDLILSGEKLPGTRLVLSELEAEINIGRGPIREALMRLDRSGLVKNIPYKGAVVDNPPTRKEISYIFDIRVDIEVKLAVEALDRLTGETIERLGLLVDQMKGLPQNYYSLDREFHNIIYAASDLPHLCEIVQKLIQYVETFLNLYRQDREDCTKFNAQHAAILAAIKANDKKRLATALTLNIKSGLEVIEKTYQRLVRKPS